MQERNTSKYVSFIERLREAKAFMRITAFTQIFCFLFVFYTPSVQAANEVIQQQDAPQVIQGNTNEEKLANTLQAIKDNVGNTKTTIDARLAEEGGIIETILAFFNLSELQNESLTSLQDLNVQVEALNQKALADFSATEANLKAKGLPEQILQRHYQVVEQYKTDFQTLQNQIQQSLQAHSLHEQKKAMDILDEFLQKKQFKPEHQPLDPNDLPWGNPDADDTRKPQTDPQALNEVIHGKSSSVTRLAKNLLDTVITPAHADNIPGATDLAETPDVKLTESIKLLAQQLNNNPIEIYNWVHNNIEFIPTYGSIQGADYTLQTLKGNAFDTASLLIALLRAVNIPARYAYGTVDIPSAKVMNWVGGATVVAAAQQILGQGGIPNKGIVKGGVTTSIEMEHVWVEAWVDFEASRGIKNSQGDSWIPMDASFKQYEYITPVLDTSGFSYDGQALVESIGTEQVWDATSQTVEFSTAIDNLIVGLEAYTDTQYPEAEVSELLGEKKTIIQELKQLSPDLPYTLIAQIDSYSVIPDNLRHKFRYQLGSDGSNNKYITYEVSLPEIAGKQISVNYQPATIQDTAVLESFIPDDVGATVNDLPKGIPGYLINLRAQFNIDGLPILNSGADVFMMGQQVQNSVALYSPTDGWKQRDAKGFAGEHRAIGLSLQGLSDADLENVQADLELINQDINTTSNLTDINFVEKLMQTGIYYYLALNDQFNKEQSKPADIIEYRLPSFGYFHTTMSPSFSFGTPINVAFSGVTMDVPLLQTASFSKDNNKDAWVQYNRTKGPRASYLENWVPEEMFNTEATRIEGVSAAKVLDVALAEGQQVFTISAANAVDLNNVIIGSDTRQDLINAINAGKEVTVHERPISFNGWNGSGYIVLDPNTGAGGYILAGGINGGFLGIEQSTLLAFFSLGVDFIPGLGSLKAIIELVTGRDLITGEPINTWLVGLAIIAGLVGGAALVKGLSKLSSRATKSGLSSNVVGQIGEAAVKQFNDIGDKAKILINGRNRIPDGINKTTKTLSEVKNTAKQSYTQQLRDFSDYAKKNDLTYDLYVRGPGSPSGETILSGPLSEAIAKGDINPKFIPGTE